MGMDRVAMDRNRILAAPGRGRPGLRGLCLALVFCLAIAQVISAAQTGKAVRHHKVAVEDPSSPPELTQAESAIEKKDYATAEPLLKKVVERDGNNYAAWFDLGFLYNALGKSEDSIAAYRKSVAAKADVFESNLNLGLMLAKTGQPDAEQFLRAATKLKPTAQPEEGQFRAWLSLAQVLADSKPEEALDAFVHASELRRNDPEPHLSAGQLLERNNRLAEAEREYKQALALEASSSDALIGLANVYMRGKRFAEADDVLAKLVAMRPDDSRTHIELGRVLAAEGKTDKAISELQAGLKLAP